MEKRSAIVGETIIIVRSSSSGYYQEGQLLKVDSALKTGIVTVEGLDLPISPADYLVLPYRERQEENGLRRSPTQLELLQQWETFKSAVSSEQQIKELVVLQGKAEDAILEIENHMDDNLENR